jgi:hypothetical protein
MTERRLTLLIISKNVDFSDSKPPVPGVGIRT